VLADIQQVLRRFVYLSRMIPSLIILACNSLAIILLVLTASASNLPVTSNKTHAKCLIIIKINAI
jgi:hypothetical protein